jgi:ATP-binding cassette subfamily C protein
MVPVWLVSSATGGAITSHGNSSSHVFYSKDNGATWNITKGRIFGSEYGVSEMCIAELSNGSILINGTDEKDISLSSLHQRIALLEQDTYLFNSSIADNIAISRPGASREEIREAAERAGIADFIETLPEGYDTQMGEMSARLSGGERQRVGIARVLLKNPDVIIMDEPTSALDVLHEKELLYTLKKEYRDAAVIVISHRMSSLSDCDRILKLEDRKLVSYANA